MFVFWVRALTLVDMSELKVERVDFAAHAKFLADNPPDDPYSLPPVVDAYREVFSRDVEFLQIVRKETTIASSALFTGTRIGRPTIKLMPIRAYDGVHFRQLGDSKSQKQEYDKLMALQRFEEFLHREYAFYQIVFQPGLADIRPFQWAGARVIPQYTYVVYLDDFSEENYTRSLRRVLKSAESEGLTVGGCEAGDLISFTRMSYGRHARRPPVTQEELRGLLGRMDRAALLDTKCVRNRGGDIVAGIASLRGGRGLYMYAGGVDAEAEKGATHLLYHEILAAEKKSGLSFVDFVGANTPSINLFKSSFGPKLEIYFRVWRANGMAARLASVVKRV